jgi:peroxiredoxin Q/BCP
VSELQGLQSRLREIRALDAGVLAVSADSPEESRRLVESAGLDFPLLSDPEGEAWEAFGLRHAGGAIGGDDIARPGVFLIDREGRIAWRELTDNWRVRVRPEEVLDQLRRIP